MRPIDADAMKTKFENKKSTIQNRIMGGQMDSIAIAFYEIFIEAIDKQPTVDAVPVKWIETYMDSLGANGLLFNAMIIEKLLRDYKKRADGERKDGERKDDETD